jgi:hypothetical protein
MNEVIEIHKRSANKPTEFLTIYVDWINCKNPVTKGVLRDILISRLENNNHGNFSTTLLSTT